MSSSWTRSPEQLLCPGVSARQHRPFRVKVLYPCARLPPKTRAGDSPCPQDRTAGTILPDLSKLAGKRRRYHSCTIVEIDGGSPMRRLLPIPLLLTVLLLVPTRADALTLRDILELTRAGLGEDVLIALIEVDRPVFPVDTETLKTLKDAGVSQKVIIAMIKSGRTQPPAPEPPVVVNEPEPPPLPPPPVIVIQPAPEPAPVLPGYATPYAPG